MIRLKNLTLRRSHKVLFEAAHASIAPGERVGIVGRNGIGKSSLFALLKGHLHEDGGTVSMPTDWCIAEVAQDIPDSEESASDFVIRGDSRLRLARQALVKAEALGEEHNDWSMIGTAHAQLADAGAYDATARAQKLLLGLGFSSSELDQRVNLFSGGWRMRLQLARTLMERADLLLLDEPTNHLDLDALVWLENYLQRFEGTLLLISHDREFLDAITQTTLHIENKVMTRYTGNYSAFETLHAEKLTLQSAQFEKQQQQIAHFQNFITRFKAKATKARQAQSRIKALERMEKIAPVLTEAEFTFEFRPPNKIPNPMLTIAQAVFGYRDQQQDIPILKNLSLSILPGQRIGLLGANGRGKSTFVKTIAQVIPHLQGKLVMGRGLSIGYFAQQEMDILQPDHSPLYHMVEWDRALGKNTREQELRAYLGSFSFIGDMVHQPIKSMSGGEKARLVLSMIVWQRPNLLLLDEPTNHLDLITREALSVALSEFEGTVILVSHDRALLRSTCDVFWLVDQQQIQPFGGDLEDYQNYLLDMARAKRDPKRSLDLTVAASKTASETASATKSMPKKPLSKARHQQYQKTIQSLEKEIATLENEQATLIQQTAEALSAEARQTNALQLKTITAQLESLEARWYQMHESVSH